MVLVAYLIPSRKHSRMAYGAGALATASGCLTHEGSHLGLQSQPGELTGALCVFSATLLAGGYKALDFNR